MQSQITRAAESTVFNIAEGCGTTSQREFARFLDISIKSTVELEAQLELAKDYGALSSATWMALSPRVIDVRRMLCGLRAKVLSAATQPPRIPHDSVTDRVRNPKRRPQSD